MRSRGGVLVVVCTGVCFVGAHLSRAQEATSANLPDQFQTGEMIQIQKPKKKKAESTSLTVATAPNQKHSTWSPADAVLRKKCELRTQRQKRRRPSLTGALPRCHQVKNRQLRSDRPRPAEEARVAAVPAERKPRPRKRPRPAVQPEAASIPGSRSDVPFTGTISWQSPRPCLSTHTK